MIIIDVITARQAFDAGKTRYFTGFPCMYGHVAERMVSNGCCVTCMKTRVHKYRKTETRREEAKRYRAKHPDVQKRAKDKYRESNIEEIRKKDRENKQRIRSTNPEVARMRINGWAEAKRIKAAGRPRSLFCEICNDEVKTVFDHCHASGKFRGWICDRCNRVLGLLKDDSVLFRKMAAYLEEHSNGRTNHEEEKQVA